MKEEINKDKHLGDVFPLQTMDITSLQQIAICRKCVLLLESKDKASG